MLSEEATQFNFASILQWGQLLQKKVCSSESQFFPSKVVPIFIQGSKQEVKQLQMADNMEVYPTTSE